MNITQEAATQHSVTAKYYTDINNLQTVNSLINHSSIDNILFKLRRTNIIILIKLLIQLNYVQNK